MPTPRPITLNTSNTANPIFTLLMNMPFKTAPVNAATGTETWLGVVAGPTATTIAALTVETTNGTGTDAEEASCASINGTEPTESSKPWPVNRCASMRPRLRQTGGDGAFRTAKLLRCLPAALSFQVAEHNRLPVFVRQAVQCTVQHPVQLLPAHVDFGSGHVDKLPLLGPPLRTHSSCLQCGAIGDSIEPIADSVLWLDGRRLAGEHEKGGLKSIFGIMVIAEHTLANTQHHRSVSSYQCFEGSVFSARQVAFQQLSVRHAAAVAQEGGPA